MSHSQRPTTTLLREPECKSANKKSPTKGCLNLNLGRSSRQYVCLDCDGRVTAQRIFEITDHVCWSYRCEDCGQCYGKPAYRGDFEYIDPMEPGLQPWGNRRRA